MAGQPKTRAKREAEQRQTTDRFPEVPPATIDPDRDHDARIMRARARARDPIPGPPLKGAFMAGPHTRASVDNAVGDEINRLASALKPGLTARIARTRPTYAAGWVEDYPLDSSQIGELLDYLSHEHGGQVYRLTLLDAVNHPYFETNIPIAGPPRRHGKILTREAWEGVDETTSTRPNPIETRQAPDQVELLLKFMNASQENERHAADRLMNSVEKLIATSQRENQAILRDLAATKRAETESQNPNFMKQIAEWQKATTAIKEIASAITADDKSAIVKPEDDDLNGTLKAATKDFISNFMMAQAMKNKPTPQKKTDIPNAKLES